MVGVQFERRSLADHDLLAGFFLDGLVNRQHAHVVQDRFADDLLGAGRLLCQDDVDVIVGQDETACAIFGGNIHRYRAHARGQHDGEEARAFCQHHRRIADRLADGDRSAHDGTDELLHRIRPLGLFHETLICRRLRPELPADVAADDQLTATEVVLGDQNVDGRERRWRRGRRRGLAVATRQIGRNPASGESDTEDNETSGFHNASLPT